ncbi:MAG: phenylalanine--tRNA ligase subunit beta [Candidatus Pacebacteria bacterium]|nr:phenylalanine--tRNA ligase subunit beta [Candidatus Paceibacterota bacterium]
MKISYNWLKSYIPEVSNTDNLVDIFNYHLCEVEGLEKKGNDTVFDINILPNRAHDLLSHRGVARELASLLDIKFIDPILKYKIPESKPTKLIKEIKSDKCRRYMGRVIRNVKVAPSSEWVVKYLESMGQRSINNIVDATNIVMFDCGQPAHVFDLEKVKDLRLQVRYAENGEKITLLGGGEKIMNDTMMVISDDKGNSLDIAGIKGGTYAELNQNTTEIILECANFDPTSVRKTAQALNIFTDARKRFENDLSPELAEYGIKELSALIYEMCPNAIFEDIVDIYPEKQKERKLSFSAEKISKILGLDVSIEEIENILKRYNFTYVEDGGRFEIVVPPMRLDLVIEEDMAEEIGRILGYDKVKAQMPEIGFQPKQNETYFKISFARNKLLEEGYSEVMTSSFCDEGEVEVLASASDKNFLRTNLTDGLKESLKLDQVNAPLLGIEKVKIFEIGTIFKKSGEEMHVAYGDKKRIKEMKLKDFLPPRPSGTPLQKGGEEFPPRLDKEGAGGGKFKMWSLFPFIARDIAVWVPENVQNQEVAKIIKENAGGMVVRGPELFDEFKKGDKISYAFRLVFQSYERTLNDQEVNDIMTKITDKIKENVDWQVR